MSAMLHELQTLGNDTTALFERGQRALQTNVTGVLGDRNASASAGGYNASASALWYDPADARLFDPELSALGDGMRWRQALADWTYKLRCASPCESGRILDTEFVCAAEGRVEHLLWDEAELRVQALMSKYSAATHAVALTSIREPVARVISHWLHCTNEWVRGGNAVCSHGAARPPAGVAFVSKRAFQLFLRKHRNGPAPAWPGPRKFFRTANLQVALLASVPHGKPVLGKHLQQAKRMLSHSGEFASSRVFWMAGTTDALTGLFARAAATADMPHAPSVVSHWRASTNEAHLDVDTDRLLGPRLHALAARMNKLDTQLHEWVRANFD